MFLSRLLLLLLSLLYSLILVGLCSLIKSFILSKPPGRRFVTSDIHVLQGPAPVHTSGTCLQATALQNFILGLTVPMAARALWGPLPFPVAFLATEYLKVAYSLFGGVSNFSAMLQLAMLRDVRWRPWWQRQ